ncbi:hypothetical protein BON22_1806 [Cyberlindnera fabianii]|uniref:Fe2OG dioxygenase domain-containing protein n=1 Tax=Cyberlindnera fabianii TaxID=36022 RepID=A0A1V2LAW4_CYBFA|nr:hypothetical protein BON22_1806 [Cyberlindnera fabianii]
MPAVLIQQNLSPDVLEDNTSYKVPDDVYDQYLAPILKEVHRFGISNPANVEFDVSKHLLFTDDYYEKTKRYTLEELGHTSFHQQPISEIGVSEPFPLFTPEAIAIMRYEMFQKECFAYAGRMNNNSTTGDKDMYVRGYMDYAPFTRQAWNHPKVMEIMSKMAGVELLHQFDYEISHTNISVKQTSTKIINSVDENDSENPEEIPGIVSWHYDSPQFVCVLMLSDTTNMIGGETALMKGDGTIAKVAGPKQGWCNVLQGRILRHIATKPKGDFTERITAVCSFRPADPLLDECAITTVRPCVLSASRYNEFYKQYMNYRLDVLAKRIQILKDKINTDIDAGIKFNQLETIEFMKTKISDYSDHTWQEFEVVEDGLVERPASYNAVKARWM